MRLNAVRHGVLAEMPVLPLVESEERWERLRRDLLDWFGLEGPFQQSLGVENIGAVLARFPELRHRPD